MKRSAQVLLVLSGAILSGCSQRATEWDSVPEGDSSQVMTNNTYVAGRGYYHAPYYRFYPYRYNEYFPGRGYYHGGSYTSEPDASSVHASAAARSAGGTAEHSGVDRGGFARSSGIAEHAGS